MAQAKAAGVDVNRVIDTVRHRLRAEPGRPGTLGVDDGAYRAVFDAQGFALGVGDGELRLSLRNAQRRGSALGLHPGPWRGEANVAARDLGAGLTERVTARTAGLEWDVVLAAALPGTGDLDVTAHVAGPTAATHHGGNWRLPLAGGTVAHLDELVVTDATGAVRYRALPELHGTTVHLRVPASVLAGAAYPLTLDPTVSPEHPVSEAVPGTQGSPAVAFDGTNFLVVWHDLRSGTSFDIFGARVSPAGTVLDPTGIPISSAVGHQRIPAVAFDGTDFVVTWQDERAGTFGVSDIFGARVSPAGTVLDPAGIPITSGTAFAGSPAVAFDGTNVLMVWQQGNPSNDDIYGARVSPAGTVLDPGGFPISTAASIQGFPAVAFDGTNFLVAWQDRRFGGFSDVFGARVSPAGAVLNPSGILISNATNGQNYPAVAFNGTNFLVVWQDTRSGHDDIYGARVSPTGTVLDASGIPISTAADAQIFPAVAFDGTNFLVVWQDLRAGSVDSNIFGARVSSAGTVVDASGIPISTAADAQGSPAVAFGGTKSLVVWSDSRAGGADVFGTRVNSAGTVHDSAGIPISIATNSQTFPAVAFDGTNFLVVWADDRFGNSDIFGTRVSPAGKVLDASGVPVSTAANDQSHPAVAFDGTDFVVVWTDDRSGTSDIYGARVSPAGAVLDASGIPVSTAANPQRAPAVAFDGTNSLVVWTDVRSGTSDIYGARVSPAGTVLDASGIPISTAANTQGTPAVAFDGTNSLVVWADARSGNSDIYAARVSPAGTVLDPSGIPVSTAADTQSTPTVASDGTNSLVVWADRRNRATSGADIYGARVNQAGSVLEPSGIPISTAPGDQDGPIVVLNGYFLVVWQDRRSGTRVDIYGARMRRDGSVADASGLVIAVGPTDEQHLGLTAAGGTWGVVYDRFDPPYGATRAFLRTVSPK